MARPLKQRPIYWATITKNWPLFLAAPASIRTIKEVCKEINIPPAYYYTFLQTKPELRKEMDLAYEAAHWARADEAVRLHKECVVIADAQTDKDQLPFLRYQLDTRQKLATVIGTMYAHKVRARLDADDYGETLNDLPAAAKAAKDDT